MHATCHSTYYSNVLHLVVSITNTVFCLGITASMNLQTRAAVTSSRETVENIYAGVGTHSDTATQNVQLESNPAYQPATSDTSVHRPNQYEEVETQDGLSEYSV